jgi:UDP-glucose 4-epimerase
VVKYALGLQESLIIFGADYPTPDGSCVRDYIHVTDLAEAHLLAMDALERHDSLQVNLGSGVGVSNFEVIKAVARVTREQISPTIGPPRPGDPPELYADPGLSQDLLGWRPTRSSPDRIVRDVVEWFISRPRGFDED